MTAEANVQLVDTFDEIKMLSAKSVTKEQQDLVNQVFGQMSNENTEQKITELTAKIKTSSFLLRYIL
jgi:TnpA family transposase